MNQKKRPITGALGSAKRAREPIIPDSDDRFDRIPLIAARLLKDNNFKEAAQRAYALFDACREQRDHRSISQLVGEARYVHFNDAVREITGLTDREHGPKEYREFCLHVLLPLWQAIQKAESGCGSSVEQDDLSADQYVDRFLEKQRDQGISEILIASLKPLFEMTKPKRRRTPKSKRKWRAVTHFAEND